MDGGWINGCIAQGNPTFALANANEECVCMCACLCVFSGSEGVY